MIQHGEKIKYNCGLKLQLSAMSSAPALLPQEN